MPRPYEQDLRKKVLECHLEKRMKIVDIAKTFGIGRNTVGNWIRRLRETGNLKPRKVPGAPRKVIDSKRFRKIVDSNPRITLSELARKYGGISVSTAGTTLARLGYKRKKTSISRKGGRKVVGSIWKLKTKTDSQIPKRQMASAVRG